MTELFDNSQSPSVCGRCGVKSGLSAAIFPCVVKGQRYDDHIFLPKPHVKS